MPRRLGACVIAVVAVINSLIMPRASAQHVQPHPARLDEATRLRPVVECDLPRQEVTRSLWNANLWTNGVVPYEFDANATQGDRDAMRDAMNEIEAVCGARFVSRTGQANYLHIQDSTGNNSFVGMIGGGQVVNINNWNSRFTMCHELIHALGVWHEQQRSDRDSYVTINLANVCQNCCSGASCDPNFSIRGSATPVGPYDFDSVMHYSAYAWSANGQPTIVCLPPYAQYQSVMGQHTHLSVGDQQGLLSRYDVAPVAWTQQMVGGPSPRGRHAMAYDAARGVTVLFGGFDGGASNGETWEWNGTAWTQRVVNGPTARYGHAMVYDAARAETVLFGGLTGTYNGETWVWNGAAWTQRVVTGPPGRYAHAMVYDAARAVTVLFGGLNGFGYNGETWEWNGTAWTQRVVSGPTARYGHAMAYDAARGVTVLFGGATSSGRNRETWEWDGTAWTERADLGPSARFYHAMAYDAPGGVTVLFGGDTGFPASPGETWEWDGTNWTQRAVSGSSARQQHAMAYDAARGVTVLFGGSTSVGYIGETWVLGLPCRPSITTQPSAQTPCSSGSATFTVAASGTPAPTFQWRKNTVNIPGATGSSLIIDPVAAADAGSYDCIATNSCGWATSSAATLTVNAGPAITGQPTSQSVCNGDSVAFTASAMGPGPLALQWRREGLGLTDDGRISGATTATLTINPIVPGDAGEYSMRATNSCGSVVSNAAALTVLGATGWVLRADTGPGPRTGPVMAYETGRQRMVLFGGHNGDFLNDTWEWDGSSWTQRATTGPTARSNFAMAYDAARQRTVLFGGFDGQNRGDTWEWDGTSWAARGESGPTARVHHAMAYDGTRQRTVLFGGNDGLDRGDTWEWDGISWTLRATAGPTPRTAHRLSYDAARQRTVLFGGYDNDRRNDTWEWDGSSWTLRATGGPAARNSHAMAYDALHERTVVFGGVLESGFGDDTWAWNGTTWLPIAAGIPAARYEHTMAYDAGRQEVFLFGGRIGVTNFGDSWGFATGAVAITLQPMSQGAVRYATASFMVAASGSDPIAHQWRRNGVMLSNGGHYSGVGTTTLVVTQVGQAIAGVFDVVVTDHCGSTTTSSPALLTVYCVTDRDRNLRIEPADIAVFVTDWFASLIGGTLVGDYDGNGRVDPSDVAGFVNTWFDELLHGCQ